MMAGLTEIQPNELGARVYRWALVLVRNEADAADLAQATLTRYYEHRPALTSEASLWAWLRKTLVRLAIDRGRRRDRGLRLLRGAASRLAASSDATPVHAAESAERRERLRRGLDALSEQQRLVLLAKVVDDLTFRAIAAELGVSESTVKTHFVRALSAMRALLDEEDGAALGDQAPIRERI